MKKTTVKLLALSLFGLLSLTMTAQKKLQLKKGTPVQKTQIFSTEPISPSGFVRCATDQYEAMLKAQDPNRQTREEFEAWLAPKIAQIKADKAAGRNVQTVYNIPVVIHVITDGDAIGTGENITDAQAISQINVLNQDYRRMMGTPGYNTDPAGADIEVNFCIAQTDPSGNPTTGVEHLTIIPPNNVADTAGGPDWETQADINVMKASTIWDTNNYMNFWSVRFGGNPSSSGGTADLLGYAQFPNGSSLADLPGGTGSASTDGAVCLFNAFGTIAADDGTFIMNGTYNLGRTMTHEVGHWLGLYHTFQGGCANPGDYCNDTPQVAAANFGCPSGANSCTSNAGNDMIQNYMDYTDDSCMNEFTNDQKTRIQAVMSSANRRVTLNASTACQAPTPIIRFDKASGAIDENTNCSYTDVPFLITIGKGASKNADITFNVTGGTATQGVDYQIIPSTVTFLAGSITSQNLTVRVFNDGLVEGNESINVSLVLNANGGDAVLNSAAQDMVITIRDNDNIPTANVNNTVFSEDFEDDAGWTKIDGDGDGNVWQPLGGAQGIVGNIQGTCAFSETDLFLTSSGTAVPNNYYITPVMIIPAGITSGTVNFDIGYYTQNSGPGEHYEVYFTSDASTEASILAGTVLQADTITPASRATANITLDLVTLLGPGAHTGYLVFRHIANPSGDGILLLDTLDVTTTTTTNVQTAVNTGTAYNATISGSGSAYGADTTSGNIMVGINDTDNFDYGCATVAVSRDAATAGAPAVDYGTNTATYLKVMAKIFTVTAANANPTGTADMTFYFTEAEIAAWESATGNVRANLKAFKPGDASYTPMTIGSFGATNVTLTGSFTTGAAGDYYFGAQPVPLISFDLGAGNTVEGTDCSFTDVSFPISISKAASKDADLTFNVTGSTATAGDYQIIPSTVTFLAGTTTPQNLTIRVFHDGLVEGNETINALLVLNANGGDATLDATKKTMTITINDDDVMPATTTVQDVVNTATQYQNAINGTGTAYATDNTSGNMMLSVTNNDVFDYGCTTVAVSRDSSTPAYNFGTNTDPKLQVTGKTFTVTPTNANASGNVNYTFYFTEAEIAAWETATTLNRTDLKVVKQGDTTYIPASLGSFGATGVTLTSTLTSGAGGEFHFGSDPALGTSTFDLSNNISIYPNPAKEVLNISTGTLGLPDSYKIYNNIGQVLKNVDKVSDKDLSISTASYSNGMYFIQIVKDGASTTKKFVKN